VRKGSEDYLRTIFASLADGYPDDCVAHACRLVELLLVEGEAPWIARLRDTQQTENGTFHGPLIPMSLTGRNHRSWTTHYVACAGGRAYDPLAGEPIALADYVRKVFGRALPLETLLDADRTAKSSHAGTLRATISDR
jgi:hypothetical protein